MRAARAPALAVTGTPAPATDAATAFRPEQIARLECLRIAVTPQLMRDAGMAIKFAQQLVEYVMNGAEKSELGGQGSQPPA